MSDVAELTYRLDAALTLAAVDDAWSRFASENGAPELVPPGPLRKSILSFISDPTTRQIYHDVFAAARRRGTISFPLRCDSPSLRRFLRLNVTATDDAGFLVRSTVLKVEARPAVLLLETSEPPSDEFLRGCSWCKRFDVRGQWVEVEVAIEQLRLFEGQPLPRISHGMCETCLATMEKLLED
jgi:hypothetical protein